MMELTSSMTFAEWAEVFLRDYAAASLKPSALEHYEDNLHKHVIPEIGAMPLGSITTADIQAMLHHQEQTGNLRNGGRLAAKSMRNMRTAASACFSQAVENGILGSNPVTGTVVRKAPRPRVEVMEDESLRKLRDFLCTDGNLMNAGIILAEEFALRRGEICALRWRDYDGVYLHVRDTVKRLKVPKDEKQQPGAPRTALVFNSVKTESSDRHLAVSPALQAFLEAQRSRYYELFDREAEDDDFIIYSSAGGITDPDNLSHYFTDLLDGLGLPHVKLHALRHTFASRAIEMGVDIDSVSGILGHANVTTTAYYYLKPRQKSMNDALWQISGATSAAPSSLPAIIRGREVKQLQTGGRISQQRSKSCQGSPALRRVTRYRSRACPSPDAPPRPPSRPMIKKRSRCPAPLFSCCCETVKKLPLAVREQRSGGARGWQGSPCIG